jgi:hypothetical protein
VLFWLVIGAGFLGITLDSAVDLEARLAGLFGVNGFTLAEVCCTFAADLAGFNFELAPGILAVTFGLILLETGFVADFSFFPATGAFFLLVGSLGVREVLAIGPPQQEPWNIMGVKMMYALSNQCISSECQQRSLAVSCYLLPE